MTNEFQKIISVQPTETQLTQPQQDKIIRYNLPKNDYNGNFTKVMDAISTNATANGIQLVLNVMYKSYSHVLEKITEIEGKWAVTTKLEITSKLNNDEKTEEKVALQNSYRNLLKIRSVYWSLLIETEKSIKVTYTIVRKNTCASLLLSIYYYDTDETVEIDLRYGKLVKSLKGDTIIKIFDGMHEVEALLDWYIAAEVSTSFLTKIRHNYESCCKTLKHFAKKTVNGKLLHTSELLEIPLNELQIKSVIKKSDVLTLQNIIKLYNKEFVNNELTRISMPNGNSVIAKRRKNDPPLKTTMLKYKNAYPSSNDEKCWEAIFETIEKIISNSCNLSSIKLLN